MGLPQSIIRAIKKEKDCLIHDWEPAGPAEGAFRKGNEPEGYYFLFQGELETCADCPAARIVFNSPGLTPTLVDGVLD